MNNRTKTAGYVSFDTADGIQEAHFGMNAWRVLYDEFGSTPKIEGEKMMSNEVQPVFEAMTRIIYSASKARALEDGEEFDYTEFRVGNWVNDMLNKDYEKILDVIKASNTPPKPLTNKEPGKKKRK